MPYLPLPRTTTKEINVSLVDHRGETSQVSIQCPAAATETQMLAAASAISVLSNAGAFRVATNSTLAVRRTSALALDDAESSVATKCIMVFEDINGNKRTIQIPAPDRRVMNEARTGLNLSHADVVAAIDAVIALLNGGAAAGDPPDWKLRQTSIAYTTRSRSSAPVLPNVSESSPVNNE